MIHCSSFAQKNKWARKPGQGVAKVIGYEGSATGRDTSYTNFFVPIREIRPPRLGGPGCLGFFTLSNLKDTVQAGCGLIFRENYYGVLRNKSNLNNRFFPPEICAQEFSY